MMIGIEYSVVEMYERVDRLAHRRHFEQRHSLIGEPAKAGHLAVSRK
jgi:hypothetical protein